MKDISSALSKLITCPVSTSVPLAPFTTLKIGGPAEYFVEVKNKKQLTDAVLGAQKLGIPFTLLGGGSNVLISDQGIQGLVIRNQSRDITVRGIKGKLEHGNSVGSVFVEADSGVIFNSFVRFTIEEGYKGIEMHLGLPGTVGGAVYMNSKWTKPLGYVGDVLYQGTIITNKGEVVTVPHEYFHFDYDTSILQKTHETLVSATFLFERAPKEELWARANESIEYRRRSQPQGVNTPGCTFRNISEAEAITIPTPGQTKSAGYLIDAAGMKGAVVGKAQISTMHANFIVNLGGATASDVTNLIAKVKETVKTKFNVDLKEEIEFLGKF
jgi:UDP-N-acetylenolpyruvoylglucosamine reductase